MKRPVVYLVGAGPGDPGLITARGVWLLSRADCVIYDGLVNPTLLEQCRADAELICVRKRCGQHSFKQSEINALLVEKAQRYGCVVRLKGGDPGMFARAAEEVAACIEAQIPFELVPGVTAATAAAQYSGFWLTDREQNSQVMFVTGRETPDKEESSIDWDLLARFRGMVVFYMGVSRLERIAAHLIENGRSPQTPTAVVQNATLPTQRSVQGPLESIAQICRREGIEAPALLMVGRGAAFKPEASWFVRRPLFGRTILITRDAEGNRRFAQRITEAGGIACALNTIEVRDLTQTPEVELVSREFGEYDWIVFTSGSGVQFTFEMLYRQGRDGRAFDRAKIACIGEPTSHRLREYGMLADFVPTKYTGAALAAELADATELAGKRVLLLRSAIAPDDLPDRLRKTGAEVRQVHVYTTVFVKPEAQRLREATSLIESGKADWLTFTSRSTVRSFFEMIPADTVQSKVKIASIGPETTKQLETLGVAVTLEAGKHTTEGLIEAMAEYKL